MSVKEATKEPVQEAWWVLFEAAAAKAEIGDLSAARVLLNCCNALIATVKKATT